MKSILFYTGLLAGTFWACGGGGNEEPTPEPPIPSVEKIEMKVAVSGIQPGEKWMKNSKHGSKYRFVCRESGKCRNQSPAELLLPETSEAM